MKIKMKKYFYYSMLLFSILCIAFVLYNSFMGFGEIKTSALSMYSWLNKQNPMIAGAISLWLLTTITYITKGIPWYIWNFIKKQTTVTLTFNNYDDVYAQFTHWYFKSDRSKKSRTLVAESKWDDDICMYIPKISAGYGTHYFFFSGKLFQFYREEKEATMTIATKEQITLKTIGRSQTQFNDLLKELTPKPTKNTTKILKWKKDGWCSYSDQQSRSFDSVILPKENKDKIVKHLDHFMNDKDWYIRNGIPYRTGIILYGPAGTGKTSFTQALCEYYNKPLHILALNGVSDDTLESAFASIPPNAMVLIEDIDTYNVTHKRDESNAIRDKDGDMIDSIFGLTLSGLLNSIDGVVSSEGRILIATTNHIDKLDSALNRKGRFNLNIEIGYLTPACFSDFFKRFYPEYTLPNLNDLKNNISPAELQALIIDNRDDPEFVFNKCMIPSQKQ